MATPQALCKDGDLPGLRVFFGELPPPLVAISPANGSASGMKKGNMVVTAAFKAWRELHPEANVRLDDNTEEGHTLLEIAAANGHIGALPVHLIAVNSNLTDRCCRNCQISC